MYSKLKTFLTTCIITISLSNAVPYIYVCVCVYVVVYIREYMIKYIILLFIDLSYILYIVFVRIRTIFLLNFTSFFSSQNNYPSILTIFNISNIRIYICIYILICMLILLLVSVVEIMIQMNKQYL